MKWELFLKKVKENFGTVRGTDEVQRELDIKFK